MDTKNSWGVLHLRLGLQNHSSHSSSHRMLLGSSSSSGSNGGRE